MLLRWTNDVWRLLRSEFPKRANSRKVAANEVLKVLAKVTARLWKVYASKHVRRERRMEANLRLHRVSIQRGLFRADELPQFDQSLGNLNLLR